MIIANWSITNTLDAAPPEMTALIKMPMSCTFWPRVDVRPLTLTPNPAEPLSLSGMSRDKTSFSEVMSSSGDFSGGCKASWEEGEVLELWESGFRGELD